MKKINYISMCLLILLTYFTSADRGILLVYTYDGNQFVTRNIDVISDNNYYIDYFKGDYNYRDNLSFKLYDDKSTLLESETSELPDSTILPYNENISKIEVYDNKKLVKEIRINTCNYNDICQPCFQGECYINENALTCSDCKASEKDNYCNVVDDEICDPDCVLRYAYCGEDCPNECIEDTFFAKSCNDYGWSLCKNNETCVGNDVELDENSCCLGLCKEKTMIEDYYANLDLDDKEEIKKENYSWIFITLGVLIILFLSLYYLKKKKIIFISLISISVIASGIFLFYSTNNIKITGMASYNSGNLLESVVTRYYTPYDGDFSTWCSPVGFCFETTEQIRQYYASDQRTDIDDCLDRRHGGWCCVIEKGFYEDVKCQGSGLVRFTDAEGLYYKKTAYHNIGTSKETSGYASQIVREVGILSSRTVACPNEFEKGTKFFIDYGDNNPWTGCYECNDRGAAIVIEPDGTIHLDLYVGIGRESLDKARDEASGQPEVYLGCSGREETPLPLEEETSAEQAQDSVSEEILSEGKIGFYYLNPSFRTDASFNLNIFSDSSKKAKELVKQVEGCGNSLQNCVNQYKPDNWNAECSESRRMCKFDVDTEFKTYVYDFQTNRYEEKPILVKFALEFPISLPDSPLDCDIDKNLGYFTVGDYVTEEERNSRRYSRCVNGENENVLGYINEGFVKYDALIEARYTPLLLMMQCFAESKCTYPSNGQGFCQVARCPDDYPKCHENSEEGKSQNILAAAHEINNNIEWLNSWDAKERLGLNDEEFIKLILFTYNRGSGTVYGFTHNGQYLKGVKDYMEEGDSLENAMLHSCYNVYDAGVYGECGGSKEWCCSNVGGPAYVNGIIYEYENWLCPNVERV